MWIPAYGVLQDLKAKTLEGKDFDFGSTKNKVVLIVNVACDCGYTKSSYTSMVDLYKKYRDRGFEILAFPSNQFGAQESRPEDEIRKFVETKYGVEFPLFEKVDVNGANTHPVFEWLKKSFPGDITWNFASKFIVDADGVPVERCEKENWSIIENKIVKYLDRRDALQTAAKDGLTRATSIPAGGDGIGATTATSSPSAHAASAAPAAPAPEDDGKKA